MKRLQKIMCIRMIKLMTLGKIFFKVRDNFEMVRAREKLKLERMVVGWKFYRLFFKRISRNGKELKRRNQ